MTLHLIQRDRKLPLPEDLSKGSDSILQVLLQMLRRELGVMVGRGQGETQVDTGS